VTGVSRPETVTITVNGSRRTATAGGHLSLLRWLREEAGVTDPKHGCGEGVCGACAVLVDGLPVASCIVLAAQVDGGQVTTAAGLCGPGGSPGPLQEAFHRSHAAQCGFCTPGMLVCAAALLAEGRRLSRPEIREALHGNICRCTGYGPIVTAIESAQSEGGAGGAGQ
jgi:carbon-monoxide dehydrogenase small subunit